MGMIKVYEIDSLEYNKLKFFASVFNHAIMKKHKKAYYVDIRETYFDYGADWKYTALITENLHNDDSWQSLNPREYEKLLKSDSFAEVEAMALKYAEGIANGDIMIEL